MTRVDRCICAGRSFASLLEQAQAEGLTPDEVAEACGAGAGCHMCLPYVRRACRTGQTVFDELLDESDETEQIATGPGLALASPPHPTRSSRIPPP